MEQEEQLEFDVDILSREQLMEQRNRMHQRQKRQKEKKKKTLESMLEYFLYIGIAVIVTWLVLTFVAQRTVVEGDSMWPTLEDGQSLIVDKLSYRFAEPKRFDIIVFPAIDDNGEDVFYIKRIIGMPGETLQIMDNKIYIDGKILEENYGYNQLIEAGYANSPVYIKEDEYFVIGDNRAVSKDSRYLDVNGQPTIGCIQKDMILGKAIFRIWPINSFGTIKRADVTVH